MLDIFEDEAGEFQVVMRGVVLLFSDGVVVDVLDVVCCLLFDD